MQVLYRIVFSILFFLYVPKILIDIALGRKTKEWLKKRLFPEPICMVKNSEVPIVWVHAVSVGEVMAVEPVLHELMKMRPCRIILSTVTVTGMETAQKRCGTIVDQFCFLPFDFRFSVRRLFKHVRPDLIVFSEGDVWPEFVFQAKKTKAFVAITNAKLSDRSFGRMKCFSRIGKWLFSKIDTICVQNELYAKRFQKLISQSTTLIVTGNTKGDTKKSSQEDIQDLKRQLGLDLEFVITLGSTHAPEEQKLLAELLPLLRIYSNVKLIIVPRHPHRFDSVFSLFEKLDVGPCVRISKHVKGTAWKVLLVDKMGLLEQVYGLSSIAVVCGSFVENIGGHNVLEALQWGVPCIVGPHMRSQKTIMEIADGIGGVVQVPNFSKVSSVIDQLLREPEQVQTLSEEALLVATFAQGAAKRCADSLNQLLR